MDAQTLYDLVKPHLDSMESTEKRSFSALIRGSRTGGRRRKILSLTRAKEKLRLFRSREIQREGSQGFKV